MKRRRSDQELPKRKRERERKKEEDSRIGEVHDKFLLRKGVKILKTVINQSLFYSRDKEDFHNMAGVCNLSCRERRILNLQTA